MADQSVSMVIAEMRRRRRAGSAQPDSAVAGSNGLLMPLQASGLAGRLGSRNAMRELARTIGLDDPAEAEALADDLETALARAGYHWQGMLASRALRNRRPRRRTSSPPGSPGRSGRPRGAQNFAARQLGLELAVIWFEHTGRPPTRYESNVASRKASFTAFVAAIVDEMPSLLRRSGSLVMPGVEYMVRTSIADFRAARAAPEEYRRRGLIDEALWLGTVTNDTP